MQGPYNPRMQGPPDPMMQGPYDPRMQHGYNPTMQQAPYNVPYPHQQGQAWTGAQYSGSMPYGQQVGHCLSRT
jgi:hypothetical protein